MGLRDSLANRAVDVQISKHPRSPAQVVGYARRLMAGTRSDFDEAWCVVDVDDFDIDAAARSAARSNIQLAVSNPCFEFWLLLHHEECRAALPDYRTVVARLRRYLPAYDKADLDFADYADTVTTAVERAKALGGDHLTNPSTSMWRLVEKIMG